MTSINKYSKSSILLLSLLGLFSANAEAVKLRDILKEALSQDPTLMKARADEDSAYNTMKASEGGHYPTVSVIGQAPIAQNHDSSSDDMENSIGLKAKLNLYAWGGIQAAVERDKYKMDYYHYKFYESQEQLGETIGKLYIQALNAKETLVEVKKNIVRHQGFVNKLNVIAQYDVGRRSEASQALARFHKEKVTAADLQRNLALTLSRLSKYTGHEMTSKDLEDPFKGLKMEPLMAKYDKADPTQHPSILAQEAQHDSVIEDIKVNNSSKYPRLDLEGTATNEDQAVYLSLNWDIYNQTSRYQRKEAESRELSTKAGVFEVARDVEEQARSAIVSMRESKNYAKVTKSLISAQKQVATDYADQFYIGRRSLLNVLDAYAELSSAEKGYVSAKNDFRTAALDYLLAKASIAKWADVPELNLEDIK